MNTHTQWHWIVALLLSVFCGASVTSLADEPQAEGPSGFRWWWEEDEEAPVEGDEEENSWMFTSPFANVTWPEIKLPQVSLLPPWRDEQVEPRGTWMSTPFTRAREAARGAIDRTRTAWNGAVERMKFAIPGGEEEPAAPQIASSAPEPGFWQRLFGAEEPPEGGPNSVGDLMAKELDRNPSRIRR